MKRQVEAAGQALLEIAIDAEPGQASYEISQYAVSETAKPLGFPSAIAHGMWTKARCLAALEPRLPAAFTIEAVFKRPIRLPGTVAFAEGADSTRFGVRDAKEDTPHLDGAVSLLPG